MGKRTSIYLSGDREASVEASGKTVIELIDLGLDSLAEQGGRVTRGGTGLGGQGGTTAVREALTPENCKHPRARRSKGLCMACGTYIGAP